jgi:hypothetical protein
MLALLVSLMVVVALVNAAWAPIEARKVRDGRNIRSFFYLSPTKGNLDLPHDAFRAKYLSALKRHGWPLIVIGALQLAFAAVIFGGRGDGLGSLAFGFYFFLTGLTSVRCRRIIDSAADRPAVPAGSI